MTMTNADEATAALDQARQSADDAIAAAADLEALETAARAALGKKSVLADVQESIKHLPAEDRPRVGQAVAAYRAVIDELVDERRTGLLAATVGERAARERLDLSIGGHARPRGHAHPVAEIIRELEDVFVALGYDVSEGPEVETDWYNFEALNFPKHHPAREIQDTLYVNLGKPEEVLLRTHTSPVQMRTMERREPPIYTVVFGQVYRNDTIDARHSPVFHQIEALAVDEGLTFGDLVGTIETFVSAYFQREITVQLLPHFFPFTEPSAELHMTCPFCEGGPCRVCDATGWIELGGCGMVHPNVLRNAGYDPERVSGFALGFGLERMVMLKYGIDQIGALFDNDIRFANQF